ncbi:MAG: outer membrane lipoprotein carrier protein LolA [Anaeromyxobacter sp.]|nr:outer membrane lipoprotein carrier protein LolA [Anaeromyxobacter sp.]
MLTAALAALLFLGPVAAPAQAPTPTPPRTPAPAPTATPTPTPTPTAAALVRRVQAFYERTRDLTAAFTQTYTYAGMGRKAVSTGTLRVKKPGLLRWDYATPSRKTIAVTGARLVQYEPDEQQAYVDERFDATAMSAAVTFLLGTGDLAREFEPSLGEGGALVLVPRQADPRVARITLTTGPDGEVLGTAVVDGAGNENRLVFSGLARNGGLADADFQVALPPGVRRLAPPGR